MAHARTIFTSKVRQICNNYVKADSLVSSPELKRLGEHKYSAVDNSWLDDLCMKKWWEFAVTLCPLWIAPNLITLIGLIINLLTVLILASFSYTATEPAPFWAYLQAALGLFLYQTLDAIDGKQARRTGSSSPLGELFDHGCDSMTQVFVTLNICYALRLGLVQNGCIYVSIISVVMFYAAHWSTYCSGTMKFCKCCDVALIRHLLAAQKYPEFQLFGYQLRHLVILTSTIGAVFQICGYLNTILSQGAGKNGSTIAGTSVIFPLFPLLTVVVPFCMAYKNSQTDVFDQHITMFCLCFGAVGAKATNRLVIAHMSKSELRLWDWIYAGPLAILINQKYELGLDEFKLLLIVTVYCYFSLFVYCTVVCRQFCDHLNINCFTLGPRRSSEPKKKLS
ncbi:hypothetical protein WR25_16079 [Diploscapter pachys]|uniref:Uncharacterized protein n=1 Tax=Diploscapter pachys TaxID=2018661 RepID=A0A2A2KJ40_9BILA|nr:hypothetical protein WR25_16079 [Diploscapter pachys]